MANEIRDAVEALDAVKALKAVELPEAPGLMLTVDQLANIPPPAWLVEGLLPSAGLTVAFGPPASLKSFLALDVALSVASGCDWQGRETRQGPVLYIAAEGVSGFYPRIQAWLTVRPSTDLRAFRLVPRALNLLDRADRDTLLECAEELEPRLLVVDTLARCMVGANENDTAPMGRVVEALDEVRRRHETASLAVHHTTKDGGWARGSGALAGAADTMLRLKRRDQHLALETEKQKNAAEGEAIRLRFRLAEDSGVLELDEAPSISWKGPTRAMQHVSQVLQTTSGPLTGNAIEKLVRGFRSDTVRDALNQLVAEGCVRRESGPNRSQLHYFVRPYSDPDDG
ncbi:MAG TPA: AAA family ATPase [Actinomycetota bacterium]|nr:AAA family ATPase [Actinomycetota bacterium]